MHNKSPSYDLEHSDVTMKKESSITITSRVTFRISRGNRSQTHA